ncbi:MAG: DUF3108 domain-containing protein [Bdellovibrionota bacterium]
MASRRVPLFLLILASMVACAGRRLGPLEVSDQLPQDLPHETQVKFDVQPEVPHQEKRLRHRLRKRPSSPTELPALASRRPEVDPIWLGEEHLFQVRYFGANAGEFGIKVLPYKQMDGRKVYHLRAEAISSPAFGLIYRLDDVLESFLDYEELFSHRFHMALDESRQSRDQLELHDQDKAETFYWNRWKDSQSGKIRESRVKAPLPKLAQDSLSALFYLRTVPLADGTTLSFPVVSQGTSFEAVATVVRRERAETPLGERPCIVVKIDTRYHGDLQKRGDTFLWLTDDERRFLVRLEAQLRVGTIVASLKGLEPGTPPK